MNYKLFFICLVFVLFIGNSVYAVPTINNVSLQSKNIWLGETQIIFLNCTENNSINSTNTTISNVFARINATSAIFPNNDFELNENGLYSLAISTESSSIFNRIGLFNVTLFCENTPGDIVNTTVLFTVSNLRFDLNRITSPIYVNDIIEINSSIKKDGNPINSDDITFELSIDNTPFSFEKQLYYTPISDSWILELDSESLTAGAHTLSLTAKYSDGLVSIEKDIEILKPIEFSIIKLNKDKVVKEDDVVVTIKAINRGSPVTMDSSYLSLFIGTTSIDILDLSSSATTDAYDLKFKIPSKSYNEYDLKINFNYVNTSLSDSKTITYVIPITGTIYTDSDDKRVLNIEFKSSNFKQTITTNNIGKYSTSLPSGLYDILIKDNSNKIEIYDSKITSFDDSIKYQSMSNLIVEGIHGGGIYYYDISSKLESSEITLTVKYDSTKIIDASSLETYICKDWNTGTKKCASNWEIINSNIDTLKKIATISNSIPNAAYIIGNKKTIDVGVNIDKTSYSLNEKITITGLSQDTLKNTIPNAIITANILGSTITASTVSNSQGIFSLDIDNPKKDGEYTVLITVSKKPYLSSQKKINFDVVKTKEISIVGNDLLKLYPKDSQEMQFRIINTGEADLSDITVSLEGIPKNYYQLINPIKIELLEASKEIPISIYFDIPKNASKEMISGSLILSTNDISKKQNFVLNILESKNNTNTLQTSNQTDDKNRNTTLDFMSSFALPTGFSLFNVVGNETTSLILFALICLMSALLLRKKRLKNVHFSKQRTHNEKHISELKQTMTGQKKKEKPLFDSGEKRIFKVNKKVFSD